MRKFNKVERIKREGSPDVLFVEAEEDQQDDFICMTIPVDTDNADYQEVMKLQREGKVDIKDRVINRG